MPPRPGVAVELGGVEGGDKGLSAIALANNFNAVGRRFAGGHVWHKPLAHAPPAGFFAPPLNAAAGPGQLLAIKQAAAGANHPVGKVRPWALKNMARRPGMF